uniref:Uncharacterized protein n=2 Tax=Triticinae TaxID=1648030 RepID=A0A453EVV8_AEGTS
PPQGPGYRPRSPAKLPSRGSTPSGVRRLGRSRRIPPACVPRRRISNSPWTASSSGSIFFSSLCFASLAFLRPQQHSSRSPLLPPAVQLHCALTSLPFHILGWILPHCCRHHHGNCSRNQMAHHHREPLVGDHQPMCAHGASCAAPLMGIGRDLHLEEASTCS